MVSHRKENYQNKWWVSISWDCFVGIQCVLWTSDTFVTLLSVSLFVFIASSNKDKLCPPLEPQLPWLDFLCGTSQRATLGHLVHPYLTYLVCVPASYLFLRPCHSHCHVGIYSECTRWNRKYEVAWENVLPFYLFNLSFTAPDKHRLKTQIS